MEENKKNSWNESWREGFHPWHCKVPNQHLLDFFSKLLDGGQAEGKRIYVPMCGKSVDLIWLWEQGLDVVGCELSEIACQQFFQENNLKYTLKESDTFKTYIYDERLKIIQGDVFLVNMLVIGGNKFDFIWDCHALSALDYDIQEKYLANIMSLLSNSARILLNSFDYDPILMRGPPIAMNPELIRKLYGDTFTFELLERSPAKDIPNRVFMGIGEDAVVYLLKRK